MISDQNMMIGDQNKLVPRMLMHWRACAGNDCVKVKSITPYTTGVNTIHNRLNTNIAMNPMTHASKIADLSVAMLRFFKTAMTCSFVGIRIFNMTSKTIAPSAMNINPNMNT